MANISKIGIKLGGGLLRVVGGKEMAKDAMSVSTKNAAKKAEAKSALKAAAKKKALTTPKSGVTVTKRPGTMAENSMRNTNAAYKTKNAASGASARLGAARVSAANANAKAAGRKTKVVKIK